jgi:hypothetical protein
VHRTWYRRDLPSAPDRRAVRQQEPAHFPGGVKGRPEVRGMLALRATARRLIKDYALLMKLERNLQT